MKTNHEGDGFRGKIVLENITKQFDQTLAVNNLSLEVKDKSFVSLLGPSGCGKTTILNIIAGLLKPTSGNIYIGDVLANDLQPEERNIGLVHQDYAIFPMSAYDNIAFGLKIKKRRIPKDEIRKEVEKVATLLDMHDILPKKPQNMSLNEMQKVALARTLVTKPSIFLMDEPLSNLDASLRVKMRSELKRLHKELEQTAIYVTHDQIEAMAMSEKIAVMSMGELQQYASPSEVYNSPRNMFVAGFIGSPPMNFIDCSYEEEGGKVFLDQGSFKIEVTQFKDLIKKEVTGSELILGIRPEDIRIHDKPTPSARIEATILTTEPLGSETITNVAVGKTRITVIAPPFFEVGLGNKVYLQFDTQKIHILNRKKGNAII